MKRFNFKPYPPDLSVLDGNFVNSIKAAKFLPLRIGSRAFLFLLRNLGFLELNNRPTPALIKHGVRDRVNIFNDDKGSKSITHTVYFSADCIRYLNEWISKNPQKVMSILSTKIEGVLYKIVFDSTVG